MMGRRRPRNSAGAATFPRFSTSSSLVPLFPAPRMYNEFRLIQYLADKLKTVVEIERIHA